MCVYFCLFRRFLIAVNLNNVIILIKHSPDSSIFNFVPINSIFFPFFLFRRFFFEHEKLCSELKFYVMYRMSDTSRFREFFASTQQRWQCTHVINCDKRQIPHFYHVQFHHTNFIQCSHINCAPDRERRSLTQNSHENTNAMSEEDIVFQFDPALIDFLFINFLCVFFSLVDFECPWFQQKKNGIIFISCFVLISAWYRIAFVFCISLHPLGRSSVICFSISMELKTKHAAITDCFSHFGIAATVGIVFKWRVREINLMIYVHTWRYRYTAWEYQWRSIPMCENVY